MSKEAVFTMKLKPELRDDIARHHPSSQYDDDLQAKIEKARASVKAGHVRSNAEVEATFAAKRKQLMESKA